MSAGALWAEAESVREDIGRSVVRNLKMMARMGTFLEGAMRRTYPDFPLRSSTLSWEDYLPPLSNELLALAEQYDSSAAAPAVGELR